MTGAALPPPGGPPKFNEKRAIRRFFQHIVMGYFVGTALGIVGYAIILLVVGPEKVKVPLPYTLLALYQAGMLGGFVGVAVFMTRIKKKDDDDFHGGLKQKAKKLKPVRAEPPPRARPARPSPAPVPGGALPQPA